MDYETYCIVCRGVITIAELDVRCTYCSWSMHRSCVDMSLEDYCRIFMSPRCLNYLCEDCEHDFGEEANTHNFDTVLESNKRLRREKALSNGETYESSESEEEWDSDSSSYDSEEEITITDEYVVPREIMERARDMDKPITYTIVENGTRAGKQVLVGSDGYTYTRGEVGYSYISWRCRMRSRGINDFGRLGYNCAASVTQRGDDFIRGPTPHRHFTEEYAKEWKKEQAIHRAECDARMAKEKREKEEAMKRQSAQECTDNSSEGTKEIATCPVEFRNEITDESVEYTVIENGSRRGGQKLVSTDGFAYNLNGTSSKSKYWRCSKRNKSTKCGATVIQKGDTFVRGSKPHCHSCDPDVVRKTKEQAETNAKAKIKLTRPLVQTVKDILDECENETSTAEHEAKTSDELEDEHKNLKTDEPLDQLEQTTTPPPEKNITQQAELCKDQTTTTKEEHATLTAEVCKDQTTNELKDHVSDVHVDHVDKTTDNNIDKTTIVLPNLIRYGKGHRQIVNKHVCPYC